MDIILALLNEFREGTWFPVLRPFIVALLLGSVSAMVFGMAACAEEVSAALRSALRQAIARAGYAEKEIAYACEVTKANLSERLSGARPMTFDFIARMPADVRQWFAVGLVEMDGVPSVLQVAATLTVIAKKESAA